MHLCTIYTVFIVFTLSIASNTIYLQLAHPHPQLGHPPHQLQQLGQLSPSKVEVRGQIRVLVVIVTQLELQTNLREDYAKFYIHWTGGYKILC